MSLCSMNAMVTASSTSALLDTPRRMQRIMSSPDWFFIKKVTSRPIVHTVGS